MNNFALRHTPQWNIVGNEWHMIVGNRHVATLRPNFCTRLSEYKWLALIDDEFEDYGWHATDCETLAIAKFDLEQWWFHMCRGEAYQPDLHCPYCLDGTHSKKSSR